MVDIPTSATLSSFNPHLNGHNIQVVWCRDVVRLAERAQQSQELVSGANVGGPFHATDLNLQRIIRFAVDLIIDICRSATDRAVLAEALFLRAKLEKSGIFPEYIPQNRRETFASFQAAASQGYYAAWTNLGRNHEENTDVAHTMQCYKRGFTLEDPGCTYVCV